MRISDWSSDVCSSDLIELPAALSYDSDLASAVRGAGIVLIVVPSPAFASMLAELAPLLDAGTAFAWVTKGFEPGTGRFLHEDRTSVVAGKSVLVRAGLVGARIII